MTTDTTSTRRVTPRTMLGALTRLATAYPVTAAITGLILIASIVRHILALHSHGYWGDSYRMIVLDGHMWNIFASLVSVPGPVRLVFALASAIVGIGFAEHRLGSGRTVISWFVTGLGGLLVGLAIQWIGVSLKLPFAESASGATSFGPVIGILGCVFASSAFARQLTRWRIRLLGLAGLATLTLYSGEPGDLNRLAAAVIGLVLGDFFARNLTRSRWQRGTHVERRSLVAAVVAIAGCGPLLTLVRPAGNGLFSPLAYFLSDWVPNQVERSSACFAAGWYCQSLGDAVRYDGLGAVLLNLLPTVLLFLAAFGMSRGRRFAAGVAIAVNAVIAIFVLYFYGVQPLQVDGGYWLTTPGAANSLSYLLLATIPISVITLVIVTFGSFSLLIPRKAVRRFVATVGISLGALAAGTAALALLIPHAFRQPASIGLVLADLPSRFLPSALLDSYLFPLVPTSPFVTQVYEWVGPVFWVIAIVAAFRLLAPPRTYASVADEARFRDLLAEHGGGTFGFMATWPGNLYWFSPTRDAAVAYQVINGVAIALSDPICTPGDEDEVIGEFARFSDELGWTPVFYSVSASHRAAFAKMGWTTIVVASEARLDLRGLHFSGKRKQNVRTALNRAAREGLTAVWAAYGDLPANVAGQLRDISETWVKGRPLPEMGFTLGQFEQIQDPAVRLMVAVDADGRVHAVTSWLPVQRGGEVIGYTMDFMRRGSQSMPGVMEFLIGRTALMLSEQGQEVLSLAGSPLSVHQEPGYQPTAIDRLTAALARWLEPVYGFSSLASFKNAFEPSYVPLDMAFPDAMGVPKIASALARAYLPTLHLGHMLAVVRLSIRARRRSDSRAAKPADKELEQTLTEQ